MISRSVQEVCLSLDKQTAQSGTIQYNLVQQTAKKFDWCYLNYFIRNGLVALLKPLFARIFFDLRFQYAVMFFFDAKQVRLYQDSTTGMFVGLIVCWPRPLLRYLRGPWRIFSDSSVTLAQWWRARDSINLVIRRSPVRFWLKTRHLRFIWTWANRPSSKGSKLLFPVIKANQIKSTHSRKLTVP